VTTLSRTWQRYNLKRWALLLLVAVLLFIPLPRLLFPESKTITNSLLFSFTQLFMLVTLASDWNLTGGFTGYVDFGHAVFFGIGAYGTGIVMNRLGWPFWAGLLLGAV
jgi:branched-chain amino acid transport system permease protein